MNEKPSITGREVGKKVAEAFRKGLEADDLQRQAIVNLNRIIKKPPE